MNAYDNGDNLILDVVRHPKTFISGKLERSDEAPRLERWTINQARNAVSTETICDRPVEFPRVSPLVECGKHRYGYMVQIDQSGTPAGLLKQDLLSGEAQAHPLEPNCAPSEGIFVPDGLSEDEGYLPSIVYDPSCKKSHLRIIDAQDFGSEPIARVNLPVRVPFGFHGNWITYDALLINGLAVFEGLLRAQCRH